MLKVLPGHIVNLIAAGEVVQRPSSVVKELMENAVDACATSVQVNIKDSGKTLIQVIDDGCGMNSGDAKTAFQRHATSKLTEITDLETLRTFGFRGEALASIAAVSEVTLRTRQCDQETGVEVKFAESQLVGESTVATPVGSNFSVKNIFYNIPARRKFLKTDASEYRQILSEFNRVVLTRPEIAFKFSHNGTEIYSLSPANTKQRILHLLGKEIGRDLIDFSIETSVISIKGYICKPEDSRKTPGNQYFFVNNRFFRSGYFLKAIQKAYENLSAEGTIPTFFIYFETDPHKIDVNIHPAKTEVKFEDDSLIFEILQSAVKEAIGKKVLSPSIDFDLGGLLDVPTVKKGEYIPPPKIDYDPLFNPFNENYDFDIKPVTHIEYKSKIDGENYHNILFRDSGLSQKPILQLSKKYIVTTIKSGLLVIDIKRAQERILYERYLTYINNHNSIVQQNLFPKTAQLSEHSYSFLIESADKIARLGFKITFNGNDRNKPAGESREITIEGLPSGFTDDIDMLPEIIDKLISDLSEIGDLFDENLREQISATLATAATSGRPVNLNTLEAQLLIDSLYACKDPSISPSGKSCMQIIPVTELDSRFN